MNSLQVSLTQGSQGPDTYPTGGLIDTGILHLPSQGLSFLTCKSVTLEINVGSGQKVADGIFLPAKLPWKLLPSNVGVPSPIGGYLSTQGLGVSPVPWFLRLHVMRWGECGQGSTRGSRAKVP